MIPMELELPPFLREVLILAVMIISIIGLKFISPIVAPILLAVFLSILIYPFLQWLRNKGLSYNLSLL